MSDIGRFSNNQQYEPVVFNIFSPNIRKIKNGNRILEGAGCLIEQFRHLSMKAF